MSTVNVQEAGPLVSVLVARVAQDAKVRALLIKGEAANAQGLREHRASADVDVLVHPCDVQKLNDAMAYLGWFIPEPRSAPRIVAPHSIDLIHKTWPIGIDVHHEFPGFLANSVDVFETLWERGHATPIAGVPVPTPDPYSHLAVLGLHILRDPWLVGSEKRLSVLAAQAEATLGRRSAVTGLQDIASATGSVHTLQPLFSQLSAFIPGGPESPRVEVDEGKLASWKVRTGEGYATAPWLLELRRTPLWRWPATIWRALNMPEWQLRHKYGLPTSPNEKRWRLQLRRVRRIGYLRYAKTAWRQLTRR